MRKCSLLLQEAVPTPRTRSTTERFHQSGHRKHAGSDPPSVGRVPEILGCWRPRGPPGQCLDSQLSLFWTDMSMMIWAKFVRTIQQTSPSIFGALALSGFSSNDHPPTACGRYGVVPGQRLNLEWSRCPSATLPRRRHLSVRISRPSTTTVVYSTRRDTLAIVF